VPSRRPPVRAARRSRVSAAVVIIVVAGVVAYLALKSPPQAPRQTACLAGPASQGVSLSPSQASIAAVIAGVASSRHMPVRAVAIAYATALQESKLANLDYGTADSVGVFQQRPSQGWGTARQIENPVYAAGRFFAALSQVPHYRRLPIDVAAQDVQHSADGAAYAQYASMGTDMAEAFTGSLPHAVFCSYGSPVGKPALASARRALAAAFGSVVSTASADPAIRIAVASSRQGWAIGAWLISHASSYGIAYVRYLDYEWTAASASGRWQVVKPGPRRPAATPDVVYG
jgi:hypothetical protein